MNQNLIVFMHIPKTAGTTLRLLIEQNYKIWEIYRENKETPEKIKILPYIKCIQGHQPFGYHDIHDRTPTYITMLRDPVQRVISEYYYIKVARPHDPYIFDKIWEENLSLEDYVNSTDEKFLLRTQNMQTRFASGSLSLDKIDLEKAKENLMNHFSVVGITEMFDQSILAMKKIFGWKNISYEKRVVNNARPREIQYPQELIDRIKEKNKLDQALYDWAKFLFINTHGKKI
jgi:hypothetical protein